MDTYEYCSIKEEFEGDKKATLDIYDAEGRHKQAGVEDLQRNIAQLGKNGWEMISVTQLSDPKSLVYFFKKKVYVPKYG